MVVAVVPVVAGVWGAFHVDADESADSFHVEDMRLKGESADVFVAGEGRVIRVRPCEKVEILINVMTNQLVDYKD